MKILAIKSSTAAITWLVTDGNARSDATLVAFGSEDAPAGGRGEQLTWAAQELIEIITRHKPDTAVLSMSEGQNSLADRAQMDGVVLATLDQKKIVVKQLFSASVRAKFAVRKTAEVAAAVADLPAASNTTAPQRQMLAVALAILPE